MQGSVALAGAAVLAMAGGTEAFAPAFVQGRTPAAAHSSAKGLSSCRQAPGRVITPLSALRMVATDPTTDLKVCIFLLACNPARDKYIEALLSILCTCTGLLFANSVCGPWTGGLHVYVFSLCRIHPHGWPLGSSGGPRTPSRNLPCPSLTRIRARTWAKTSPSSLKRIPRT